MPQVQAIAAPLSKARTDVVHAIGQAKALTPQNVDANGPALVSTLNEALPQIDLAIGDQATAVKAVQKVDRANAARQKKIVAAIGKSYNNGLLAGEKKANTARMFKFEALMAIGAGVVIAFMLISFGLMWYLGVLGGIVSSVATMFLFSAIASFIPWVAGIGGGLVVVAFVIHWYEAGSVKAALVPKHKRQPVATAPAKVT